MNELVSSILNSQEKKMSSLEIAELTKKSHFHIMRDIRSLIDEGALNESNFGFSSYVSEQNKELPMYELDFLATMTLITGYDAKRRALVIERWAALERGEAAPALVENEEFDPVNSLTAFDYDGRTAVFNLHALNCMSEAFAHKKTEDGAALRMKIAGAAGSREHWFHTADGAILDKTPETKMDINAIAMKILALVAEASRKGHSATFLPGLVHCRQAMLSCEQTARVLEVSSSAISSWHRKLEDAGVSMPKGKTSSMTASYLRNTMKGNKQMLLPFSGGKA